MTALDIVYSLPFLLGAIVGLVLDRIIKCAEAKWLDKHRPNPDGTKHRPAGYSRTYVAGLAAAMVLGYVMLTMIRTEERYENLAQEVSDCAQIAAQNDDLSMRMREWFLKRDETESAWLKRLVAPDDPEIATLKLDDPRRQEWGRVVSIIYNEEAAKINAEIRAIQDEQNRLVAERQAKPTCRVERG